MNLAPAAWIALPGFPCAPCASRRFLSGVAGRGPQACLRPCAKVEPPIPDTTGGKGNVARPAAPLPHGLHCPRSEAEEIARRLFCDQDVKIGKVGFGGIEGTTLNGGIRGPGRAVFARHAPNPSLVNNGVLAVIEGYLRRVAALVTQTTKEKWGSYLDGCRISLRPGVRALDGAQSLDIFVLVFQQFAAVFFGEIGVFKGVTD